MKQARQSSARTSAPKNTWSAITTPATAMLYWGKRRAFLGRFLGAACGQSYLGSAYFLIPGIGPLLVAGPLVVWTWGCLRAAAIVGGVKLPWVPHWPVSAFRSTVSCDTRPRSRTANSSWSPTGRPRKWRNARKRISWTNLRRRLRRSMLNRPPLPCNVAISVRPDFAACGLTLAKTHGREAARDTRIEDVFNEDAKDDSARNRLFPDLAANAFHAALWPCQAPHNARLILLYVKQPQETIQGEFGLMPPEPEATDATILARLGEMTTDGSPIPVERLVVHGKAAEVIVQVAKEKQCDLIVLGTHGRKGLARFFYGNVADADCHRAAPCPVLAAAKLFRPKRKYRRVNLPVLATP